MKKPAKTQLTNGARSAPAPPAVYRPQPTPRVLQRAVATGQRVSSRQASRPSPASLAQPSVSPAQQKIVRPNSLPAPRVSGAASSRISQPKMPTAPQSPKPPPIYHPQPKPRALQKKDDRAVVAVQGKPGDHGLKGLGTVISQVAQRQSRQVTNLSRPRSVQQPQAMSSSSVQRQTRARFSVTQSAPGMGMPRLPISRGPGSTGNGEVIQRNPLLIGGLVVLGGIALGSAVYNWYRSRQQPVPQPGPQLDPQPLPQYPYYLREDPNYDSDEDQDWTPTGSLRNRHARLTTGQQAEYPLERFAQDFDGTYTRLDTATGPFSVRNGRANQPFLQSRLEDYEHQRVGLDYDDIVRELGALSAEEQEDVAHRIVRAARGVNVDFSDLTARQRRAATHLIGITQIAEEHSSRTPSSAAFARAALAMIADGAMTFHQAFNRNNGAYVPARHGGTGLMRDFINNNLPGQSQSEFVSGNLSDSD